MRSMNERRHAASAIVCGVLLCVQALGGSAPVNDDCEDRIEIGTGDNDFSNTQATTDGPVESTPCDDLVDDIWYNFEATCTGQVRFSTCDQADFDSVLAVYDDPPECSGLDLLACVDDTRGCSGGTSETSVSVRRNRTYKIRIGGKEAAEGPLPSSQGSGILTIEYTFCCFGDLDGDTVVGASDLAILLGAWGSDPDDFPDFDEDDMVGASDLALLLGTWGPCDGF